jgi:transcriptional regulator with XRE-family HTH domain
MSPKPHFPTYLKKHRKAAGLSMEELAEAVGVAKSMIHYWETGANLPRASHLEPLARALGVSYEDVFAAAGYVHPEGMPDPAPYLRAKFPELPKKAIAEAEKFFAEFEDRYGVGGDDDGK